jgi:peptide deformylase
VTRAQRVEVRGLTLRGKKVTLAGEGLWARAMQHEVDHLDGVLFTDLVIPDSLGWVTGETDNDGNLIERPTTLADALHIFEQAKLLRP